MSYWVFTPYACRLDAILNVDLDYDSVQLCLGPSDVEADMRVEVWHAWVQPKLGATLVTADGWREVGR